MKEWYKVIFVSEIRPFEQKKVPGQNFFKQ